MLKKCDYCGKEFETNLTRQRFCCKACHTKWHNTYDVSHSWAEYTKRKIRARQRYLSANGNPGKAKLKKITKEAERQAWEKEQEACQNVMETLMNQISFENYINWLDENIPDIISNAILEVTQEDGRITASVSQCTRVKLKLVERINELLEESSTSRLPVPAQWVNTVKTWPSLAARTFLASFNIDLDPRENEGESLDNGWILISIGEDVPNGAYWWAGFFNLGWKWINPRTLSPKWDINLITERKP